MKKLIPSNIIIFNELNGSYMQGQNQYIKKIMTYKITFKALYA